MEKVWLNHYPEGVPHDIDVSAYNSALGVFNAAVEKFRDNPSFSNLGATLTYAQLDQLAAQFAAYLQKQLGLQKGDRIAIQMPNLLQYPVALFGAMKAGLIIVNTNPLYTAREMQHQFKDSGAKAIVLLANSAHFLEQIIGQTDIQHVIITEVGDMLGFPKKLIVNAVIKYMKKMVPPYRLPGATTFNAALEMGKRLQVDPVDLAPDDIAFFQYTGGTTGVAKGAMLSHRNIVANMLQLFAWMKPNLQEGGEVIIAPLPLYHIYSLTVNCLTLSAYGSHNILITNPRDLKAFLKELTQWKFTLFAGLNTLFIAMMNHPDFKNVDFSHCKFCVSGGMALQDAVAKQWQEMTGTPIYEAYGLTEASPGVTSNPFDNHAKIGSIGQPFPSTDIKIVDDDGNACGIGEAGELWVSGPQVMQGYWNMEDETKGILSEDGWLRTGDITTMDDEGFLRIVDRKKDMILVSGFNVYPNEIEEVMSNHPAVLEVAAVGIPDERAGEVVKLFVVKKEDVTEQALIDFAREQLTGYKVPKTVEFRSELPKTVVGKILRRALRDKAE